MPSRPRRGILPYGRVVHDGHSRNLYRKLRLSAIRRLRSRTRAGTEATALPAEFNGGARDL